MLFLYHLNSISNIDISDNVFLIVVHTKHKTNIVRFYPAAEKK